MNISNVANKPKFSNRPKPGPAETKANNDRLNDPAWNEAGDILEQNGISADDHSLMQENIATYVSHRNFGKLSPRWTSKLNRELASPYTDAQVHARLESLEDSLQANIRELPAIPTKIYISGSFVKGRLGANSDLNGFAVVDPEHMSAGYDSYEERKGNPDASSLLPLSSDTPNYNRGHLLMTGKSIAVTPEQILKDGFLKATYDNIQADKKPEDRRETSAAYEKMTSLLWSEDKTAKDKRDTFENPSLMGRIQNGIVALGGALSATPLVGPVVSFAVDLLVAQDHKDLTAS